MAPPPPPLCWRCPALACPALAPQVTLSVMDRLGLERFGVVAHSYGTFMASRLAQRVPRRLAYLSLLDPVCFFMFTGKLIHNFVYHNPVKGSSLITWWVVGGGWARTACLRGT